MAKETVYCKITITSDDLPILKRIIVRLAKVKSTAEKRAYYDARRNAEEELNVVRHLLDRGVHEVEHMAPIKFTAECWYCNYDLEKHKEHVGGRKEWYRDTCIVCLGEEVAKQTEAAG